MFLGHRGCYILSRQHGKYVSLQKAHKQLQRKEREAEDQGETASNVVNNAGRLSEKESATNDEDHVVQVAGDHVGKQSQRQR